MADEESPIGRPLAGSARGQAARRRWYFAHEHFKKLRKGHDEAATAHRKAAEWAEQHAGDVRARNRAKEERYHAEMRDYEQKRLEKEESRLLWTELRREIRDRTGGVRSGSVTEDYAELPRSVRTRGGGENIDNAAEYFGMSQDEFVRYVASTKRRADRAAAEKLERPKRPALEKEPRRKLTAQESETRRTRRREIAELSEMIRQGEAELGKNHPALSGLYEARQELKAEMKAA